MTAPVFRDYTFPGNAATVPTVTAGDLCRRQDRLILEMGNFLMECTLLAGHDGCHYDAAFSREWVRT